MQKLLITILAVCVCVPLFSQENKTVTFDSIPEGNYAVSVIDKQTCSNITNITEELKPYTPFEIDSIRNAYSQIYFNYETEQVISGRVRGTFGKVKKPLLHIFVPRTGYRDTYDLQGKQRFHLHDMDFVEGTEYVFQVTKPNGGNKFIQLYIDTPFFPEISVSRFLTHEQALPDSTVMALREYGMKSQRYFKEEYLPDVVVTGKKITPMNIYGLSPEKGYGPNDSILNIAMSMDVLLTRLGFSIGRVYGIRMPYKNKLMGWGNSCRIGPVPPVVYIDDFKLENSELEEIFYLSPNQILQMEYFSEDQEETRFTLGRSASGTLMIYTKYKSVMPLSAVTVKQIGYRPACEFDASSNHGATIYWNPSVKVGEEGRAEVAFPLDSDRHCIVILEGLSDKGELVRKEVEL